MPTPELMESDVIPVLSVRLVGRLVFLIQEACELDKENNGYLLSNNQKHILENEEDFNITKLLLSLE